MLSRCQLEDPSQILLQLVDVELLIYELVLG
jgi:hypothetical protein